MLVIAHRGASKYEPENSMAAFRKAVELGTDYIEADVQLTSDDIPVIRHDRLLDRTTNISGYIHEINYAHILDNVKLKNGEKVPTLEELCKYVASENVKLYVDLKAFGKEELVVKLITNILPTSKFIIGAFHSQTIKNVKKINQAISTVLIIEGNPINLEKEIVDCECDIVAFGFDAIEEHSVSIVKKLQKKAFGWTIDDYREIKKAMKMGLDGITSNYPDRVISLL